MHSPRSTPLQAVRKAIGRQTSLIANSRDARSYRLVTLTALRLAEALILNGFDLEQVIAALQAVGGGDGNLPVPVTEQSDDVNHVLHEKNHLMETTECPSNGRIA